MNVLWLLGTLLLTPLHLGLTWNDLLDLHRWIRQKWLERAEALERAQCSVLAMKEARVEACEKLENKEIYPRRSTYAIYAYIGVVLGVNVGKYGIRGVSGYCIASFGVLQLGSCLRCETGIWKRHLAGPGVSCLVGLIESILTPQKVHLELRRFRSLRFRTPAPFCFAKLFVLRKPCQEEMTKFRKRNFKLFSRCFSHLDFALSVLMLYQAWATPGLDSATWATCCVVGYLLFTAVAQDFLELTPQPVPVMKGVIGFHGHFPLSKQSSQCTVDFTVYLQNMFSQCTSEMAAH